MAYVDQYTLANNATFLQQIRIAAVYAAIQIAGEASPLYGGAYDKRHALAAQVLSDGCTAMLQPISYAVAANNASGGALTSQSSDSDIQFIVNSVWGDVAGVSAEDLAAK
jgi:hypothetical protein